MIRPLDLDTLVLQHGAHASLEEGACVMEAISLEDFVLARLEQPA